MRPSEIAENIVDGNRADAAQAIATSPNPANTTILVLTDLIDAGMSWRTAIATMTSLTDRSEFWEEPR